MKEFVEFIAKSLVDDPTQVEVRESRHGSQVISTCASGKKIWAGLSAAAGGLQALSEPCCASRQLRRVSA